MGFLGSIADWFTSGGVASALSSIISALLEALTYLWNAVVYAFQSLIAALVTVFGRIGGALRWLWDHVIKAGLTKLANVIIKLHQWLEAHLAPVLKFLAKVRAWWDRIFRLYVRPILVMIQHIRRVLLVLRLLHIKFAQQLDNWLAQVQSDITRVFLTVRGTLNSLIDVVNAISNPTKLVRLVAASVAVRRSIAGICRMTTGLPIGWFFPNTRPDAPAWEKPVKHYADLTDPARNPLAGTLFGAFDPLPVSDFMSADPIPTDAVLNSNDPLGYFQLAALQLLEQEQREASFTPGVRSLRLALEQNTGTIADSANAWAESTAAMWGA